MTKLIKISEASNILDLIDQKSNKPKNHILRFWEKEFNGIKPKKINNQRYYTLDQINRLKTIKYLLKDYGMTISGVKKFLKSNTNLLDENHKVSLKNKNFKNFLKLKSLKLLEKINRFKIYGKKNSS